MQEGLDSKKQECKALSANALAVGTEAVSALDQRLHLSEAVAAADKRLGFSDRAAAAKQGLLESTAAARQNLACLAHKDDSQDLELLPRRQLNLHDRLSMITQEVAADVAELTAKASKQRQKIAANVADLSQKASVRGQQLVSDLNAAALKKAASLGLPRDLGPALDPKALCFYDATVLPGAAGLVALTIDDGPCQQSEPEKCMLKEVRDILTEFDAKATLFLCTDHVDPHKRDIVSFIRDGNEVANHCGADRSYGGESERAFEVSFLESERVCEELRESALATVDDSLPAIGPDRRTASASGNTSCAESNVTGLPTSAHWFRAPHADASPDMHRVLERHGFTNVLCDSFANDTILTDPRVIAEGLLSMVDNTGGSIVVIHTPERGFREHNLEALRLLLKGLQEKGLRATSLTHLHEAALQGGVASAAAAARRASAAPEKEEKAAE
eukprot:TRINITY_DN64644_c0_g1_i1.p1 TRINITY_DN64644_c0_g1~~TRINITY_DN64644_c0_g1_i1.p1  ORF type:complete len:517 (-),score=117.80 TRINITY_DN64644_c0_g1_i1:25-1362(-)